MSEIKLTLNLPGITADQLSAILSPLLLGGATVSPGGPTTLTHRKDLDPDELITLKQATSECALSYSSLRKRVVEDEEIGFSRKSSSPRSTVLIRRGDLWSMLKPSPQPVVGRPRSTATPSSIILGS